MWSVVAKHISPGYPIRCSIHKYAFDGEWDYSPTKLQLL